MTERVTNSVMVKGSARDLFVLWANFENFPNFMKNIKSVRKVNDTYSHWVMEGPLGKDFEWDAKVTTFEPNKRIAWKSTEGDLQTSGQVTFSDVGNDSTEVSVTMHYEPPAGTVGKVIADIFDNPQKRVDEDLRNFKSYAEGMNERIHKS